MTTLAAAETILKEQPMEHLTWDGCYDDNWQGLIVPDAFAHPAKFSRGLIDRIFRYMLETGMVRKGDVVVDPFGGIGTGGIIAANLGLQWFGCELEPKFAELAGRNFSMHLMTWQCCRDPVPVLVNGDSRKLRENLRGVLANAVVCSPPFAETLPGGPREPAGVGGYRAVRTHEPNMAAIAPYIRERRVAVGLSHKQVCEVGKFYGEVNHGGTSANWESGLSVPTPDQWVKLKTILNLDARFDAELLTVEMVPVAEDFRPANDTTGLLEENYGSTPGQLGAMKAGDVNAVVCSPPFTQGYTSGGGINKKGYGPDGSDKVGQRTYQGTGGDRVEGNLETMPLGSVDAVVSSPPYADGGQGGGGDRDGFKNNHGISDYGSLREGYGDSPGQIGAMTSGNVDAVVTSPPYAASLNQVTNDDSKYYDAQAGVERKFYGSTLGNLGNMPDGTNGRSRGSGRETEAGNTFWHAARDIVSECYAILRPGGFSAWVVKDFVRAKARVPFCDDWCKLLEACGFTVTARAHAMLVKETSHPDLFGGEDHVKTTERKSFFRRLAEKKGSPRIDFEEVVFARKSP